MQVKDIGTVSRAKFYFSDGSGRDQYVLVNSGGLHHGLPNWQAQKSSKFMQTSLAKRTHGYKPQAPMKTIHYHSNGSGRDKYILKNSGGLLTDYESPSEYFKNNIRNPLSQSQYFDIPRQLPVDNDQRATRQRLQSARLSQPKVVTEPFKNFVIRATSKQLQQRQKNRQFNRHNSEFQLLNNYVKKSDIRASQQ